MPAAPHREVQAEVAHHRGDQGVRRELAGVAHGQREHAMISSPSTIRAVGVDGQAAVGVAVVGDAEVGAVREHRRLQRVEVGGAAPVVDVEPVGFGVDGDDLGAGLPVGLRRGRRRGAVGAVDDDVQPVEPVR